MQQAGGGVLFEGVGEVQVVGSEQFQRFQGSGDARVVEDFAAGEGAGDEIEAMGCVPVLAHQQQPVSGLEYRDQAAQFGRRLAGDLLAFGQGRIAAQLGGEVIRRVQFFEQ